MLQSLGSQRVRHNLVTEQQQQQCPVLELLCPVNLWVSDYSLKYSMESFRDIRRMVTKCLLLISICLKSTMIKNKQYRESNTEHTEVAQSCLTLCDPMDCSPPGFSVHGIFQAWILEWGAVSFSRGSSWHRIEPRSPALEADALPSELSGKSIKNTEE